MTTLEYWEEREKAHAEQVKLEDDVLTKRIRDRMDVLMVEVDKQIHGFYSRYAKAEGITMADAQQKVSKMDVKAFETKAAKYVKDKDFSKQANDELKLYNATMKINRLEMLKAEMGLEMVDAFSDVESTMSEGLSQRTLDEFERQAGILGVHNENMTGKVDSIVNGELNNATWSQRIWMYQGMLKNSLADLLTNGIIQGKNPRNLSRDLVKTFGVTKSNAERLMRTEMCRVQTEAQMESFKENGFERYMFISTEGTRPWFQEQDGEFIQIGVKHDSKTCPVCSALNGQVFMISEKQAGKNAPPMHPNCRCSTATAYHDRQAFDEWLDSGAANEGVSIEEFVAKKEINDQKSAELTARRKERLAARRNAKEEPDFSQMDAKQLKQYIENHLNTSFEDLKGVNTEYLREAVKVISQFEKKMGGQTIEGLSVRFGSVPNGAYAKYDDKTKTLILKKTGSLERFEESQRNENTRYRVKWKTDQDYHATETYSGTIWHELGHAVDIEAGQAFSKALSANSSLDAASVKVSAYAGTTQNVRVTKRSEAWAENFAAYMDGGRNKSRVPGEIGSMIERSFQPKTYVVKFGESGIINTKLVSTKITSDGKVVNPMSETEYNTIVSALQKQGVEVFAAVDGDDLRYMQYIGAEGTYSQGRITHIGEIPSRGTLYEEIIHMTQARKYGELDSTDTIELCAREIEANRKLYQYRKAYKFDEHDIEDIQRNLTYWEESFENATGSKYDESNYRKSV